MNATILQLSRSVIDGGFDYQREISQAFSRNGFGVTTVFQRGILPDARARQYHGRVICLDANRHRHYKNAWAVLLKLIALSRGRGFDLAICHHHLPAVVVNRLRRVTNIPRLFFIVHDYDYFDPRDRYGQRRNRFVMHSLDPRSRLIAVSQAIRRNILQAMPELDPARCLVIHNAIDMPHLEQTRVDPAQARLALGLDPDAFVFGTVGRLIAFKAHRELIDAFARVQAQMPRSQLVIIGRGPLKEELAARVAGHQLGDRVKLLDFIPNAARLMSAFDCFVLPSDNEPFGLVLLEAMANRLPVIANHTGAVPEILPYAEGLTEAKDVESFSNKLLEFHRMSASCRRQLGDRGHDHAAQAFSLENYRKQYFGLWTQSAPTAVPGEGPS
jgi:glycosyltransferase involved in cell wall biosynthesis